MIVSTNPFVTMVYFILITLYLVNLSNGVALNGNVNELRMPGFDNPKNETYACTTFELNEDEEEYIIQFDPLNEKHNVHHMILFGCYAPGSKAKTWNCGEMNTNLDKDEITASVCDRTPRILYAWAHSAPNFVLPKDVGFKIGGKSTGINYLVLQIHYAKKTEETDYSGIRITTTKKHLSKQAATMVLFTQGQIGPHSKENFETACSIEDDIPIHPFAFRVHTHAHGRLVRGWVVKKHENWTLLGERDPQLPQLFDLTESSDIIDKGDILAARCEMINEEDRLVSVGLSSRDEMCNFYLMFWIEGDNLPSKNTCYSEGPPNYYFNSSTSLKNIPQSKVHFYIN